MMKCEICKKEFDETNEGFVGVEEQFCKYCNVDKTNEKRIDELLKEAFNWNEKDYTELDDYEVMDKFKELAERKQNFEQLLLRNGFVKEQLFNQMHIYYNNILGCVVTSEYSDNTGNDYWRYFNSIKEYNEYVSIDITGV